MSDCPLCDLNLTPPVDEELERLLGWAYRSMEGLGKEKLGFLRIATSGRNDPCPCGSGRKSKKCCSSPEAGHKMHIASTKYNALVSAINEPYDS